MSVKGAVAVFWRGRRGGFVGRALVRVRGRSRERMVVDSIVLVWRCFFGVVEGYRQWVDVVVETEEEECL